MSVIRCACALLVTPYEFPIVNSWPAVALLNGRGQAIRLHITIGRSATIRNADGIQFEET